MLGPCRTLKWDDGVVETSLFPQCQGHSVRGECQGDGVVDTNHIHVGYRGTVTVYRSWQYAVDNKISSRLKPTVNY